MKRFNFFTRYLIGFMALLFVAGCSTTTPTPSLPETMPDDFSFVLDYGVNGKNQLDTRKGTYTKDLILNPAVTTSLALSQTEKTEIYNMMQEIDILSYPDEFVPESSHHVTPYQSYHLTISYNGQEKSIFWADESVATTVEATKLREIFMRIHEIVTNKDEYQALPEASGGYD